MSENGGFADATPRPAEDWLTAPVSRYSEVVLASIPMGGEASQGVLSSLSDPTNYAHVLDMREEHP